MIVRPGDSDFLLIRRAIHQEYIIRLKDLIYGFSQNSDEYIPDDVANTVYQEMLSEWSMRNEETKIELPDEIFSHIILKYGSKIL